MGTMSLQPAIRAAKRSTMTQKHGAALYNGNKLVATGCNLFIQRGIRSIHAEENVLRKIPKGCNNLSLVVVRVNKSGELLNSRPCGKCRRLIVLNRVKKVYHS